MRTVCVLGDITLPHVIRNLQFSVCSFLILEVRLTVATTLLATVMTAQGKVLCHAFTN